MKTKSPGAGNASSTGRGAKAAERASSVERAHSDFGPFDGRSWLNAAHQGPLPSVAAEAAREAVSWKVAPHRIADELFGEVPRHLKGLLGRLVGAPAEEVILGNSTSYGLHLLANGIPWRPGDEVLLVAGDFPANILPWLALEKCGVAVRLMEPEGAVPTPAELSSNLTEATRLFCASWVGSFTGHAADVRGLGEACREAGVTFVLNGSQAVGTRPLNVSEIPVDAVVSCGFKWLCGPYGTGFCWMEPELLESLEYNQAYWLAMQEGRNLGQMRDYELRDDLGARRYDVFCTANFLNFAPWAAALEYLLSFGIEEVAAYDDWLVSRLVGGLDPERYRLVSPRDGDARSTLVVVGHAQEGRSEDLHRALKEAGIDAALREGNLRFSPHLYNTAEEVDRALEVLEAGS